MRPALADRACAGTAAVEFALLLPLLVLLIGVIIDLGGAFYQRTQLQNAAQAGARYAQVYGWDPTKDPTGAAIVSAVRQGSGLAGVTASAPQLLCGCPQGTRVTYLALDCTAAVPAATYCPGVAPPEIPGRYVVVTASYTYAPFFVAAPWPASMAFVATATTRLD